MCNETNGLTVIRPRGYKTFFMLNSAEHEICPANKYQIANNCYFFFLRDIAEHEFFSAYKYLLAEKISCSAELSMRKVL